MSLRHTWLVAAACLLLVACHCDRASAPAEEATEATRSVEAPAMVSMLPPETVLADGAPIEFTVCAWRDDWYRPSFDEMTAPFSDRRFGDGTRPTPAHFSLYLSNFAYLAIPISNSINKDRVAFRGITGNDPVESLQLNDCDYYRQPLQRNRAGALWTFDYRLIELRCEGSQLIAVVEAAPGLFQDLSFLHPPDAALRLFQVVDTSGRQLYESAPDWTWQRDAAGDLDFLLVQGKGSLETPAFALPADSSLLLIAGRVLPPGGALLQDENGAAQEIVWDISRGYQYS